MILNIIAFKNVQLGCYTNPQYDDHDVDVAAKQLYRALRVAKDDKTKETFKDLEMYHLGVFNDETGVITIPVGCPRCLLNCGAILKEVVEDGKEEIL